MRLLILFTAETEAAPGMLHGRSKANSRELTCCSLPTFLLVARGGQGAQWLYGISLRLCGYAPASMFDLPRRRHLSQDVDK
jgi:hypothetical protein